VSYVELLKAYRAAHSRVLSIEPFEAALRENTPLASIADPKALTEYLNQISLKGDLVLEELKRVTTERDEFKNKLGESQKAEKAAQDEISSLKEAAKQEGSKKDGEGSASSPKQSGEEAKAESEEFFSFDNELPRLESELKEKEEQIENLKSQNENLKRDLAVARESTEGMVHNLESATRELTELRDFKDKQESEVEALKTSRQTEIDELKSKLEASESTLTETAAEVEKLKIDLKQKIDEIEQLQKQASQPASADQQADLASKLEEVSQEKDANEKRLGVLQGLVDNLRTQLKETQETMSTLKADVEQKTQDSGKLKNIVDFLDGNMQGNTKWQEAKEKVISGEKADFEELRQTLAPSPTPEATTESAEPVQQPTNAAPSTGAGKKKNKKKKKGGKGGDDASKPSSTVDAEPTQTAPQPAEPSSTVAELEKKIEELTQQLKEKEAAIDRLDSKLKGEEDLKEEIESLRDDLLNIGQEHVEAKDKVKVLTAEKTALEGTIAKLEKEITDLRANNASTTATSAKAHNDLKGEYENLKVKFTTLETELSAAQQLATTRFKDLTELRESIQKIQPELKKLRAESTELKTTKDELKSKTAELRTLEGKHDDLQAELKTLKSSVSDRETEVKTLNQKVKQELESRLKAEESLTVAQSDLRYSESRKQEAVEARQKVMSDLSNVQDELKTARAKLREYEQQTGQLNKDLEGLKEEMQLKTAQHASAQSLMNSMRDQASELGMQMKEARERCESLEEELADAHRLLSERTREGETMRRLLNDIEGRTEAKTRDLKERMEAAIEERDRAEDEASAQGRRRARELEELKTKLREVEKSLRSAEEDKEELEHSQKDWKRRRDHLEAQTERATQELHDVQQAMARLREALDESEKQVRDLEKEKAELRRSVEETNSRLEKMRKSNSKVFSEDSRFGVNPQSSRSSIDSGPRRGVTSPIPKTRSPSTQRSETPTGGIDYIYLKNVLLQFLEQKDKNYQKQLIPVLGMLLHFDRSVTQPALPIICNIADFNRTDEQKWMAAITSK
jgi:chromosome segregation ATPase